jgi:transposase InsO family protein
MDLFVVPTISFRLLYWLLILQHDRRQILGLGVTAHPTVEWISHQLTEAYGWKVAPQYIIRDRDAVYGDVFIRRLRAMSIRDRLTAPRSPWQNGYRERAIGSIRRECLDHVVVFGERHLHHLLRSYARTFQSTRTRRRREQYMPLVAFCLRHFLADFIICMCEFDFRRAHGVGDASRKFAVCSPELSRRR